MRQEIQEKSLHRMLLDVEGVSYIRLSYKNVLQRAVIYCPLSIVILPPVHIKLGLMKHFIKALNKGGACFRYIWEKFLYLSAKKVIKRVYLLTLTKDDTQFLNTIVDVGKKAWLSFIEVSWKYFRS